MLPIWICLGAGLTLLLAGFVVRKVRVTHPESPDEAHRRTVWGRVIEWLAILF